MSQSVQGRFNNRSYLDKTIVLDGSSFSDCIFSNCTMIYSGGEVPILTGCRFNDCSWQFGGDAANTITFLSGMYKGGFDTLVEATFHEIRRGAMLREPVDRPGSTGSSGMAKLLKPLRVFRIPKQEP